MCTMNPYNPKSKQRQSAAEEMIRFLQGGRIVVPHMCILIPHLPLLLSLLLFPGGPFLLD